MRQEDFPLSGVRVLEIGPGVAGAYCGKLFADMGAFVARRSPTASDPESSVRLDAASPETKGLYSAYLNAGKATPQAPTEPWDLVIIGEDAPRAADANHPVATIATLDVSWFGTSGPYAEWHGSDLVTQALAGLVYTTGPVDGPPAFLGDHHSAIVGGLAAYCAGVAALIGGRPGTPQRLEISTLESIIIMAEHQLAFTDARGEPLPRLGLNRFLPTCPLSIHRCKTGWIGITPLTAAQWQSFCAMLDLPELASDPDLQIPRDRWPHAARIEAACDTRFPLKTADEWAAIGRAEKVPMVVVPNAEGILEHPIFSARESLATFTHNTATYRVPRTPFRLEKSEPRASLDDLATPDASPLEPLQTASDHTAPLEGIRVLDFSMGWAGPLATRMLADWGAEVIKVEAGRYPDWWRSVDWSPEAIEAKQFEQSRNFCAVNRGKKSVSLDLTQDRGRALAKTLAAHSDIVVENQAAGVMPRLGLGYEDLAADRSDLIMLSMSAFGSGNEWSETRAYGSVLEQGSGVPSFAGKEGDPPTMTHIAYGDPIGGIYGGASLLTAIYHQRRTGQGQWINNTQIEAMLPFTTPALLIRQATGHEPRRLGNRHPALVPHGVFPAEGEDNWLALSLTNDVAWTALASLLGRTDWANDPKLASASGRRGIEPEIEQAISTWTAERTTHDAARLLQAAGVAAAPLHRSDEVTTDAHFNARDFFYSVERLHIGHQWQTGLPVTRNGDRFPMRGIAPFLGGDSEAVLTELAGITAAEYQTLLDDGVVSLAPTQLRTSAGSA